MQSCGIKCSCGFESNTVPEGAGVWSNEYFVPVFVVGKPELMRLVFLRDDAETDENFIERLELGIPGQLIQQFGETAVAVTIGSKVVCPSCNKNEAKVVFAGF